MSKYFKYLNLLFAVLSLVTLIAYRHNLTAPDTFNYLFIAEELRSGQLWEALSGHWGMLAPLLLVPLLVTGLEGVFAFYLLNWLTGLAAFHLYLKILDRLKLDNWLFLLAAILAVPVIINMAIMLTPDLLMIIFGLWYVLIISDKLFFSHPGNGWKAGIAGGLMYLSKGYGLPFFLAHFLIWHLAVLVFKKQFCIPVNGNIFKTFYRGLTAFLLVTAPLIIALSFKFGGFTIGTAGKYNLAMTGPDRMGLQVTKNELIDPDTKFTNLWAYEEPAMFVEPWNPLKSKTDLKYYFNHLKVNTWSIYYIPMIRDMVVVLAVLLVGIWLMKIPFSESDRYFFISFLLAFLIFTGGYWLLIIRSRYLWFDLLLLMPLVWLGMKYLSTVFKPAVLGLWGCCLGILILINTLDEFRQRTEYVSFFTMLKTAEQKIPDDLLTGRGVAIIDIPKEQHLMEANAYLWYKKRFKFLGQPFAASLLENGLQPLRDFPVDYFILWQHDDLAESVFRYENLIFEEDGIGLKIYDLKN